jgi:hypothetical protein
LSTSVLIGGGEAPWSARRHAIRAVEDVRVPSGTWKGGSFFCGLGWRGALLIGYDRLLGRRVRLRRLSWRSSSLLC